MVEIPEMTHELSRYWNQPARSTIEIDETHALMSKQTFDALSEYSASNPSGVYEGKMWKRHDGAFDRAFLARGGKPIWMLCWYGVSHKAGFVSNNHRIILVVE